MQTLRRDPHHILVFGSKYGCNNTISKVLQMRIEPIVYIIEDSSPMCSSLHALMKTTEHDVRKLSDAEHFTKDIIQTGNLKRRDVILIDMECQESRNFQLVNLILNSSNCAALIFLADNTGSFQANDTFAHPRVEFMHSPISAKSILAQLELLL